MGTDYYMRCNECKEDIWVSKNYGIKKVYTNIYEREPDKDKEYEAKEKEWARESLKEITEFIDRHQNHELGYYDEHQLIEVEIEEYSFTDEEVEENFKKRLNLPTVGEIIDTISKLIPITPMDNMYWTASCPFHDDEKSALIIDRPNQRFNCTKCYANGNVWGFLTMFMEKQKVEFRRPRAKEQL